MNPKNPMKTPDTVMFVPKTRGGALASFLKTKEAELAPFMNSTVRIIEEAGTKLVHTLTKADPFRGPCNKPKCTICPEGGQMVGRCYTEACMMTM